MLKAIFVVSAALALATAGLSPALAQASDAPSTKLGVAAKTSDRTPDNPSPSRTPGASLTGATGTEAGQTPYGTSDRTPSNHYRPPTN
jgi:hypothetical protein